MSQQPQGKPQQQKPQPKAQGQSADKPAVAAKPSPKAKMAEDEAIAAMRAGTSVMTTHQKSLLGSGFADSSAERRRNNAIGASVPGSSTTLSEMPAVTLPATRYDGKTVPPELQARDVWKALKAPVESRAGRRTRLLLEQAVLQFGLAVNPRYTDDAPGKIRGHIFVWDVSRAMDCEIPHFVGAKELTLAQTCDWVRHEGPMRGWKRVSTPDLYERAAEGKLVVAIPRDARTKFVALVLPQEEANDGVPRLTGIGLQRGVNLHPRDMFGSKLIDCFFHD